jgi:hypothetical protein
VIEQEAAILRTKTQTLESDNEKLAVENKQLHLLRLKKGATETETELKGRITSMETELIEANNKVTWCRPSYRSHFSVLSMAFPPVPILSLLSFVTLFLLI